MAKSELVTRATAQLEEKVKEELNQSDPTPEQAKAILSKLKKEEDGREDSSNSNEGVR